MNGQNKDPRIEGTRWLIILWALRSPKMREGDGVDQHRCTCWGTTKKPGDDQDSK